jgi:hypothetical protein
LFDYCDQLAQCFKATIWSDHSAAVCFEMLQVQLPQQLDWHASGMKRAV